MALAAHAFAGCTLARDGNLEKACTASSECVPDEPLCQIGTCTGDGLCVYENVADGPTPMQIAGNCRAEICAAGVLEDIADDSDVGTDVVCQTTYGCADGVVTEDTELEGTPCSLNGMPGFCDDGACSPDCTLDEMCQGISSDPCMVGTCNQVTKKCDFMPLDNVLSPENVEGDCAIAYCVVGVTQPIVDDTDVFDDGIECTDDICTQGVPSNPARDAGDPCDGPGDEHVCNGLGACVECNGVSDCAALTPITTPDCESAACNAGNCEYVYAPVNTPLNASLQTPGDCQVVVCDAAGNVAPGTIADNNDLPNDNKVCTIDSCVGGVVTHVGLAADVSCGGPQVCTGPPTNNCVGCTMTSQCDPSTFCLSWACTNNTCVSTPTANNTVTPTQIPEDCQQQQCNGTGGTKQVAINDPFIDGNPCTQDLCSSGTPSNPNQPLNFSCMGSQFCNGAGLCVQCNNNGQCNGGDNICESDDCVANNCMIVNAAAGTPAPPSQQTPQDCKLAVCAANGTVSPTPQNDNSDPFNDGIDCTADTCSMGTPVNDPKPAGTTCVGGFCNGMTTCVECTMDSHCAANEQCHLASNSCRLDNGEVCSGPGNDCFSGNCVDGRCCNTSCTGLCQACNNAGMFGTCSNVPSGTSDPGCSGTACNASGGCLLANGATCGVGSECFSTNCVDTKCCNSACGATCFTCNGAVPGTCGGVALGVDECATTGHSCNASQTCACGIDPVATGVGCPAPCDSCANGICTINCTNGGCGTLNCPAGFDCNVTCSGNNACKDAVLNCPANQSCTVDCANTNNACESLDLNCGAEGVCALTCHNDSASNVCSALIMTCGNDACSAACTGAGNPSGFVYTPNQSCGQSNGC